jgi:hypothetical protein
MPEREHRVPLAHDPEEAAFHEQPPSLVADGIQTLPRGDEIGRRSHSERGRSFGLRVEKIIEKSFLALAL